MTAVDYMSTPEEQAKQPSAVSYTVFAQLITEDGRVLAQGTPAEIVNNAEVRRVYLGENFKM